MMQVKGPSQLSSVGYQSSQAPKRQNHLPRYTALSLTFVWFYVTVESQPVYPPSTLVPSLVSVAVRYSELFHFCLLLKPQTTHSVVLHLTLILSVCFESGTCSETNPPSFIVGVFLTPAGYEMTPLAQKWFHLQCLVTVASVLLRLKKK